MGEVKYLLKRTLETSGLTRELIINCWLIKNSMRQPEPFEKQWGTKHILMRILMHILCE